MFQLRCDMLSLPAESKVLVNALQQPLDWDALLKLHRDLSTSGALIVGLEPPHELGQWQQQSGVRCALKAVLVVVLADEDRALLLIEKAHADHRV